MRELSVNPVDFQIWSEGARERWSDERYNRSLRDRTAFADEGGEAFGGWESADYEFQFDVFDHLQDVVIVVDEPSTVESYLGDFYERINERYREIDQADDIALTPEELFFNAEQPLGSSARASARAALARIAAETDLNPVGRRSADGPARTHARPACPVFCFPCRDAVEVEWQAQSTMRYHGRIADLADGVKSAAGEMKTTLFVMPSLGVAERIVEILKDYEIDSRLALGEEVSETPDAELRPVVVTVGLISGGLNCRSRI